eukprot:4818326-Amphidinium_carterae.2
MPDNEREGRVHVKIQTSEAQCIATEVHKTCTTAHIARVVAHVLGCASSLSLRAVARSPTLYAARVARLRTHLRRLR